MHKSNLASLILAGSATIALAIVFSAQLHAADQVDPYYEYRDEVERGEFDYDDSQDIPWIENEAEVLAVPDPDNLTPVRLDSLQSGLQLFIDRSRIRIGDKDRVIRVWLWVRSKAGAENGSFEGFRCETNEYKVYAFANPNRDPPVSKANRPTWKKASRTRVGNYRRELLDDYFCRTHEMRDAYEISEALNGKYEYDEYPSFSSF